MSKTVATYIGLPVVMIDMRDGSDATYGRFVEFIYRGRHNAIHSIAANYAPIARQVLITGVGPTKTLTVRFDRDPHHPATDAPRIEFRFIPQEHHKDILESELAAGIDAEEIRKIREAIQNPQEGVSPALQTPEGISLYQLMLKGVRSIPIFQPTVVLVRTASGGYQWVTRPTNVGNIYTEAQLLSELSSLTGGIAPSFAQALPQLTTARTDAEYGYRKKMPSYDQVAGGHTQETTEYEYGLWSTEIYTAAS